MRLRVPHVSLNTAMAVMLTVAILMYRPTAFGQSYATLGLLITGLVLVVLIASGAVRKVLVMPRRSLALFASLMLLYAYLGLNAALSPGSNVGFAINALLPCVILTLVLTLANLQLTTLTARIFVWFAALMAVSSVVTTLLAAFIPIDSLRVGQYLTVGYVSEMDALSGRSGGIYFPFSHLYSDYRNLRFDGFWRESGIFQAVLMWSAVFVFADRALPNWLAWACLLGIITTFSTAGLLTAGAALVAYLILRQRLHPYFRVTLLFAALVAVPIALTQLPDIGINNKAQVSVSMREVAVQDALGRGIGNVFGDGYYNTSGLEAGGITLVSAISLIGWAGFVLAVLPWLAGLLSRQHWRTYALLALPLLLTSLTSQPLLDAAAWYAMLLLPLPDDSA